MFSEESAALFKDFLVREIQRAALRQCLGINPVLVPCLSFASGGR
jgi:hypothetical protein